MIVLAIVAILAAIALPSYQDAVTRSWRRKASACLVELAQAMERRYSASMAYNNPAALPNRACTADDGMPARYAFGFVAAPTATTFDLQAIPQGAQAAGDAQCGTLALDELGNRTVSTVTPPEQCW
jgi:type IV pilus assembly protein PilE